MTTNTSLGEAIGNLIGVTIFICISVSLIWIVTNCYDQVGMNKGIKQMQLEAVQMYAADWVAKPDGTVEFRWREHGK
jgi:hypothetical protein